MKRNQKGYTVIEVLVAVIILALVLPGLATMVIASRKTQVSSERHESSTAYAQSVIDSLMMLPKGHIPQTGSATKEINGTNYTASWNRTEAAMSTNRLTVMVNWTVGGTTHSTVLEGVAE